MVLTTGYQLIADYLSWVSKECDRQFMYRGLSNANFSLVPSAFRDRTGGIACIEQLAAWKDIASKIISIRPRSDIEWLVQAQHFGIATPLMDWSTNPLVALFFACSDNFSSSEDSRVYECDRGIFSNIPVDNNYIPFGHHITSPQVVNSITMNSRTIAQDSVMTLHGSHFCVIPEGKTRHYDIPHDQRGWVHRDLQILGFNHGRMYGDLATVALNYQRSLQAQIDEARLYECKKAKERVAAQTTE